jgi:hypothetical protein
VFQVSQGHRDALAQDRIDAFARRMAERMRNLFAKELIEQNIADEQLLPTVRRAMADAAGYGVIGEMDLELYIDCVAFFGPSFDKSSNVPWAGETLQRTDIDGTAKMDIIHDYLIFATAKAR